MLPSAPVLTTPELPKRLFHYTTADAFPSIVASHSLWLTNAAYLNDQGELTYALRLARGVIESGLVDWLVGSTEGRSLREVRNARRAFEMSPYKLHFMPFLSPVLQGLEKNSSFNSWYVGSLTTEGDLLSQWRAYCPQGGYSLGFDSESVKSSVAAGGECYLAPVIYDHDQQYKLIRERVVSYITLWRSQREETSPAASEHLEEDLAEKLLRELTSLSITFKAEGFAEEREWRIVRKLDSWEEVNFRTRHGLITPYISVDLAEDSGRLPLTDVTVSPLLDLELAGRSAAAVLARHRYPEASGLVRSPSYRLRF